MNERNKRFNPDNVPEEELIQLDDFDFDFQDYFRRHKAGVMDEDESKEFSARIYGYFCALVDQSDGNSVRLPYWVANYIYKKFRDALGGVPWEDTMALPWDKPTPYFSPKGLRALDIYGKITEALKESSGAAITTLLAEQAGKHNVSYETARSAYYAFKNAVEKKAEMPKSFLNNQDEI